MNKRFFKDKITVYHIDGEQATRINFDEVYFRHNKKINVVDKRARKGASGSITIPTEQELDISCGDYVIKGHIAKDFDLRKLSKEYQLFQIVSVDDNRKGNLPHYKLGVSE